MRRLAHISDLHFGCTDDAVVEGLVAELNGDPPDLVIASGDFTQGARRAEFAAARDFLARLASPWLAVPGNHDITPYHLVERFFDPYRRYRRYIAPDIEPVWQDDVIAVVGLNTARRMALEFNWSYGRVSRDQIERIEACLTALPKELFRIVVAHHPFLPPPWDPEVRLAKRAGRALAAFERGGAGLVLSGHLHRGYARFLQPTFEGEAVTGVRERDMPAARTRRLMVVQAGSATSKRLRREPNAYNRITIHNGRAAVEARVWTGRAWAPAESAASPDPSVRLSA